MASLQKIQERLQKMKKERLGDEHHYQENTADRMDMEDSNTATETLEHSRQDAIYSSPEADSTSDISNHNEWLTRIAERGHQPEDWLEFMVFLRDKALFTVSENKYSFIVNMYARAIRSVINAKTASRNEAFAQLLVDAAQYRRIEDEGEARIMFKAHKMRACVFAFYHIAFAQFELDLGNREKCRKILEGAKEANAEPRELLYVAFQNFLANISPLIAKDDLEKCNTGTFMNYTGELSASLTRKLSNVTQENMYRPMTNPEVPCTPLLQQKNTAPQLSLQAARSRTDDGLQFPSVLSTTKPRLASARKHDVPSSHRNVDSTISFKIVPLSAQDTANTTSSQETEHRMEEMNTSGPVDASSGENAHRTLRSSHSTPDCKGPGVLSGFSSVKSNYWRIASARAAPSIRELRNAFREEDENENANNTMDLLSVRPLPDSPCDKSFDGKSRVTIREEMEQESDSSSIYSINSAASGGTPATVKKAGEDKIAQQRSHPVRQQLQYTHPPTHPQSHAQVQSETHGQSQPFTGPATSHLPVTNHISFTASSHTQPSLPVALFSRPQQPVFQSPAIPLFSQPQQPVFQSPPVPVSSQPQQPVCHSPPVPVFSQPQPTPHTKPLASIPSNNRVPTSSHSASQPGLRQMPCNYEKENSYPPVLSHNMHPAYQYTPRKPDEMIVVNNIPYCILKPIGRGGSSKVYRVTDPDKNLKAVKCVNIKDADEAIVESYMNEIELLRRLQSNSRVIKLFDFEYNEEKSLLYLVLEAGEVDLANLLRNLKKSNSSLSMLIVKTYWMNMLEAVQGLHSEGIVHSDLKPGNFVLVSGILKLIDFGIAKMVPQDKTSVFQAQAMGTLNYMSPEAMMDVCGGVSVDGKREQKYKVSVKSDVWSLGCILYFMVHGRTPFQNITNDALKLQAIANPNYQIPFPEAEDKHVTDVLKKCLVRDPKYRVSIDELLQHPFLKPEKSSCSLKDGKAPMTPRRQVLQQLDKFSPATLNMIIGKMKEKSGAQEENANGTLKMHSLDDPGIS